MSGRRGICRMLCLALTCVIFSTWLLAKDLTLWVSEDHFHALAEDKLIAAYDSVREATLPLLQAHEDEPRTSFKRYAPVHWGPKFDRLQASLDNLHRESPLRTTAPEELSNPKSVEWLPMASLTLVDLCGILAGKRITMIGGEYIYRLHVLLLQHRERMEKKLFPCPYHEFCTHHHICLHFQQPVDDAPPQRYVKPPTTRELIETESAVVNYIVSDTLLSAPNESFWAYTLPFLDSVTGVRLRETYWLAAARKANVLILGRGPMSAPGPTYAGNWSFLHYIPDYVDKSRCPNGREHENRSDEPACHTVPRPLEILNAAIHLTVSRFLPDLFQLLQSIRREVRPSRQKRLIWPSSWYRLPSRGAARTALLRPRCRSSIREAIQQTFFYRGRTHPLTEHTLAYQLSALLAAEVAKTVHLEDPWTLLFNAQVYLQNMVLRELLPRHGIVFLPLDVPWVEDGQAPGHGRGRSPGTTDAEFERAMVIGEAFLRGIDYILRYLE